MKTKLFMPFAMIISTLALTSCIGGHVRDEDDGTTTVLTVATFDGGFGTKWLEEAARRFEEKYQNQSFEEGKVGVKVKVDGNKSTYTGNAIASNALSMDVYFTEGVDVQKLYDDEKIADISDVVTTALNEFDENKTIESKLDLSLKNFLTVNEGKYYALPFYDGLYGFIYDVDLFQNKNFKIGADGNVATAGKNAGPDGVEGTYDDGLPATYAQFENLITYIRTKTKVIPFAYAADAMAYPARIMTNYIADYDGKEAFNVNYNLNGKINIVTASSPYTVEEVTITQDNGYLLQKDEGKYQALSFMKNIMLGNTGNISNLSGNASFRTTQANFIIGSSNGTGKDFAFLCDGVWWANESESDLITWQETFGGGAERKFGFMPIPKVNADKIGEKQTLVSQNDSFAFINAKTKKMELAKLFMKFMHTDAELGYFSVNTSTTRALNYVVSDELKAQMSYFGRSVIDIKENSEIVYPVSTLPIIRKNAADFTTNAWFWASQIGATQYHYPWNAFIDNSSISVQAYFEGCSKVHGETFWSAINK